jgi:hypothetical protein
MDKNRKLSVGTYDVTNNFRSIEKHIAVMFDDDCGLVAVVGAEDDTLENVTESLAYAVLFAAAPNLLIAAEKVLAECVDLIGTDEGRELEIAVNAARGLQS